MTDADENAACPKPVFTDAEAGAKEFPDSTRAGFNYYTPAKRKQTHYEDVTVEVQPDPRHYLAQGWLYGFSDGRGGYPLDWTALKAWGSDRPEPERYPGSGGKGYDWPAHGWHEFRDPNEEWELTLLPLQLQRRPPAQPEHRRGPAGQGVRAVEPELGALRRAQRRRLDARRPRPRAVPVRQRQPAGADEHAQQRDLGEQHAPDPGGPGPGAVQPDAERGDRRLRRHARTSRPGTATRPGRASGRSPSSSPPSTTGARRSSRRTWSSSRWSASCSGASLVQHAAPRNGDFVTPTVVGAEEYDFAERDLRYTHGDVRAADQRPRVRRPQQGDPAAVAVHLGAARHRRRPRRCSRCGRSPTPSRRASRTAWTRAKNRFSGHPVRSGSGHTEGAGPVTTFTTAGKPVQVRQHRIQHVRRSP